MKVLDRGNTGFQLQTRSPFIACMHHKDFFPRGNGQLAPVSYLPDRDVGNDFDPSAPFRMYHSDVVPGFPVHPHRGFETVTIVTQGYVDHSDSLGAKGRYASGDVQWMTSGKGIQHCEMFPLIHEDKENTMELFQVWLNLPARSKFVSPHYKMLWHEQIPVITEVFEKGRLEVRIIAGKYNGIRAVNPTPHSWAAEDQNHVGIWMITLEDEARLVIPKGTSTMSRMLYHYEGQPVKVEGEELETKRFLELKPDEDIEVISTQGISRMLLLEGEKIQEPVAIHGPFVMNTQEELIQAYHDYRATEFGGWPWKEDTVVHGQAGRFAEFGGGKVEYPPEKD